jgi:hypothetical protein
MSLISNFGPETNPIWVILDAPYDNDLEEITDPGLSSTIIRDEILSGGYGYNFKKIWKMGGLFLNDIHIRSVRPCIGATYVKENILSKLLFDIDRFKPCIIVPLSDEVLNYLVPHTTQAKEKNSSLGKWAGSLLTSKYISYPHYIIGSQPPDWVTRNWAYNEIQGFIDFGHIREEFEYWKTYGTLNPLPKRNLLVEPSYPDLVGYLHDCMSLVLVSVDIETIRPKKGSVYHNINCGYPYTIAIAKSPMDAISFSLWDYTPEQCVQIWRMLDAIFTKVPQIGQNYFLFDSHYLEALGFRLCLRDCRDTLIRHHILWPSLKHALHFQTRQYTREPYYKDDGKHFNIKQKKKFMRYNANDAAVTYEIYEEQEKEFAERKHLI